VIFAAAASQAEMLDGLAAAEGIDWDRVELLHLDEYVGLPADAEQSFGTWLDRRIWSRIRPARIERIDGTNPDPEAECARYAALLADGGIDLALIGIGENGHLAFNDPHVADFDDPLLVKPVEIDETSRRQQVRDGEFAAVELVPRLAITVTMPAILASRVISVVVPGPQKAAAVAATLDGPISTACPASALRHHPDAVLFVDEAAASLVNR
jgi:glucosamine-6-phosphate deaminase